MFTDDQIQDAFPTLGALSELKTGGQKVVYLFEFEGARYVLKILATNPSATSTEPDATQTSQLDEVYERAKREVDIIERCRSPYFPQLGPLTLQNFQIGDQNLVAFSEEYIEGDLLDALLQNSRTLSNDELVQLALNLSMRGYVHLHQRFKLPMTEITFFELKITDWRRAYFQAAQAQSYADRTYCVFPINKRRLLLENKNTFLRAGVGVIVFDVEASSSEEIIRAKVASPKRLSNKIYMIFQLSKFVLGHPQRKSMTQTKQKNTLFSRLISILNRTLFR